MTTRFSLDPPIACTSSWPARRRASAYTAACAATEAQARKTAVTMIKERAHAYALRPRELDALAKDLSRLSPWQLILVLESTLPPTRWFGFGGEVQAINLRSALLYARYLRAKAHQIAGRIRFMNVADAATIRAIADRTLALVDKDHPIRHHRHGKQGICMDLTAVHLNLNAQRMRLKELLAADDFNFLHDVIGIYRHLNRITGEFENCFSPRFSRRFTLR